MTFAKSSNQAAVLYAPGDVRTEERAVPQPGAHEVLVEIRSVGVCGSDAHYYQQGRVGGFVVRAPLVLGHESSGIVVSVGEGVRSLAPGQRVSIEPGVPCFACTQCRHGRYNLCADVRFFATPPIDGAFQQYVTIPEPFAYPVPDALSDDAAALLEPLSVAIWACRKAGVTTGTRVLVTGGGPIGLLAMQVARAQGAAEVAISDMHTYRLDLARALGAQVVLDASAGEVAASDLAPDALLECSGSAAALTEAVGLVRPAGSVVLVGMGTDEVRLPLAVLQQRELWVTGTFRYANTWPTARELASSGAVELDRLVTGRYGLDGAETALRATEEDPHSIKPVVNPGRRGDGRGSARH